MQEMVHAGINIQKAHTEDPMCAKIFYRILIFRCRRIWHLDFLRLPGFIGPFPPPLLIRLYAVFAWDIIAFFPDLSSIPKTFRIVHKSDMDFCANCW